jgi:hypothetical protein
MSWIYQDKPFVEVADNWGFVYIIEDTFNNKKYIGKKQFWFKKYKTVKGKRKGFLAESDWKDYYGSNDFLKEEVSSRGIDHFKRTILRLCSSKSECSYWEAKYQFEFDVLLKPEEYYNQWISVKVTRKHVYKKI